MTTILFMVSVALLLSTLFVLCYLWALSKGQFDDMETPALRILKEDALNSRNHKVNNKNNSKYDHDHTFITKDD